MRERVIVLVFPHVYFELSWITSGSVMEQKFPCIINKLSVDIFLKLKTKIKSTFIQSGEIFRGISTII